MKSAVPGGTTTDPGWASELTPYAGLTRDWIELVTRQTLLGKIPYVRVPFLTKTAVEATPFHATWVAAGEPIPVSRAFMSATAMLQTKKVGTLVPFTEEVFQAWSPATQANVLNAITRAAIYASDFAALDPSVTETAARPASLTAGISPGPSTRSSATQVIADVKAMLQALVDGGSDLSRVVIAMSPSSALHLSSLYTTNGDRAFPELQVTGGFIWGVPVAVTSAAVQIGSPATHIVAAIDGAKILVADDGLVLFDASNVTALQMDDAPSGAASQVSMFQTSCRVVRIIRYMNFQRASDTAVAWFATAY